MMSLRLGPGAGSPAAYAAVVAAASQEIRAADPQALVVAGAFHGRGILNGDWVHRFWEDADHPPAQAIDALQSHSTSNPTSFAQQGGVAALNGPQDHLPGWVAEYAKRRGYAHKRLNTLPGVSCVNVKGAFYLFPNIAGTGLKSTEFCARLLEEEKVAAVPGVAFGADDYLRISYATSLENLEKGLDRMEKFTRRLAGQP